MIHSAAIRLYDIAWRAAIPLLRLSARLKDGYNQRRLTSNLPPADLWIQAASGGEAYLAETLIRQLSPGRPTRILVTTNTRQGMEILGKISPPITAENPHCHITAAYCPFDRPALMEAAAAQVNPKLVVLLETEIWPGLLYALRARKCPVHIVNGRMRKNSLAGYRRFAGMLYKIRPESVLAISAADAARFAEIFGKDVVSVMPNIKFDRISFSQEANAVKKSPLIPAGIDFLVFGSIRREEEGNIKEMLKKIRHECRDAVIGLFPRHMHRIDHWRSVLNQVAPTAWRLRSEMAAPAKAGEIILWDTFGELAKAYASATAVFVGGSLAPLGGQNFLEPLTYGIVPVIGPSWENFSWVGDAIFRQGLVEKAANWQQAADRLIRQMRTPPDNERIIRTARAYISTRQGGTEQACRRIRPRLHPVSDQCHAKVSS